MQKNTKKKNYLGDFFLFLFCFKTKLKRNKQIKKRKQNLALINNYRYVPPYRPTQYFVLYHTLQAHQESNRAGLHMCAPIDRFMCVCVCFVVLVFTGWRSLLCASVICLLCAVLASTALPPPPPPNIFDGTRSCFSLRRRLTRQKNGMKYRSRSIPGFCSQQPLSLFALFLFCFVLCEGIFDCRFFFV